ncbi:MAG: hypothetical protein H0W90_00920 [Actinobacteria bacterium]|nr:hypothetical protein [Actinomycetota bacterium]
MGAGVGTGAGAGAGVGFGLTTGFDPVLEGRRAWSEPMPPLESNPKRFVVPDRAAASRFALGGGDDDALATASTER